MQKYFEKVIFECKGIVISVMLHSLFESCKFQIDVILPNKTERMDNFFRRNRSPYIALVLIH